MGMHRPQPSKWKSVWPFLAILVIVPLLGWGASTLLTNRGIVTPETVNELAGQSSQSAQPQSDAMSAGPQSIPVEPEPVVEEPQSEPEAAEKEKPEAEEPTVDQNLAVKVLNGTGINGYAAEQAGILTGAGYSSVSAANATGWQAEVSTVYYEGEDNLATAQDVASRLGITNVASTTGLSAPVTVILR